jgi:heptose I phosphotransferase|tara:strand:- start:1049 stop:1870 length:822 start_codon:yes stop_codon:yes gene_type:complete
MFYLNDTFAQAWQDHDPYERARTLEGEVYRSLESRRTVRFDLGGRAYYAKIHWGVGWWEIVKNCLQLKWPVLSARNEWRAIQRLKDLGIDTMTPVAYGVEGWNPAKLNSFIVTEALDATESLEEYCSRWSDDRPSFRQKLSLLRKVGEISKKMHEHGVNHRDFYICHLLLATRSMLERDGGIDPQIFVIDLHRAQVRNDTPTRWRVKDIGGLLFSALGNGLTRTDLLRFMKIYSGKPLRVTLLEDRTFWEAVFRRGCKMYLKSDHDLPDWMQR